jgi:NADH-quinone oxidoreductase subunit I
VEACPCDAIRMDTGMHPAPYDSRDQFIYEKDLLLAMPGRDGDHDSQNPRLEPGDPGFAGVARLQHH